MSPLNKYSVYEKEKKEQNVNIDDKGIGSVGEEKFINDECVEPNGRVSQYTKRREEEDD